MSTYFEFQRHVIDWTVRHGVDPWIGGDYVVTLLQGLAAESVNARKDNMSGLVTEHETPGGLNEYLRASLTESGVFRDLEYHLDNLLSTRDRSNQNHRQGRRDILKDGAAVGSVVGRTDG
jgi:pyrroline-5-carboxylate reductase